LQNLKIIRDLHSTGCAALLLLTACTAIVFSANSAEAFVIPWGDSPGQAGLVNQPEQERQGPLTFVISQAGNILLADTVHRQVCEYSPGGVFRKILISNVRPTSIALDSAGNILLLDGYTIQVYSNVGMLLHTIKIPDSVPLIEGYAQDVFEDEGLVAVNDPEEKVYSFSADNPAPAKPDRVSLGRTFSGGKRLFTKSANSQGATLGIATEQGPSARSSAVSAASIKAPSSTSLGAVIARGESPDGGVFAEIEEIQAGRTHLKIHQIKNGADTAEAELPDNYFTTVYRKFVINPDAEYWQMRTTPSGVEFTTGSLSK
jgi:hypothetical protein